MLCVNSIATGLRHSIDDQPAMNSLIDQRETSLARSTSHRNGWWLLLAVGLVLCLATAVRQFGLASRSMTHIEIYVPGIHLPEGMAIPEARLTVRDTLVGLINDSEPHPPGYYLFMLAWTRVFGSGVVSLRAPSLLFGVGSVALIYFLGALESDRLVGLLAALLLALNGHQVLWSQLAKGYMAAAFLGLLSTVLLVLATRSRRQNLLGLLYVATVLCGVAVTHFFWPLLVAQVIWVFLVAWNRTPRSPGLLHWQAVALILGTPFLALAVFQARRPAYIEQSSIPLNVVEFFEFGFLFEPDPFANAHNATLWVLGIAAVVLTVALAVTGLLHCRNKTSHTRFVPSDAAPLPVLVMALLAAVAVLITFRLARFAQGWDAHQSRIMLICAVLPILIVTLDVLLRRFWPKLPDLMRRLNSRALPENLGALRLSTVLAALPGVMLLGASLVTPVFVSRSVLLFTPYLVLLVASGLVVLLRHTRVALPVLLAVLLLHVASLRYFAISNHANPTDYRGLAVLWLPDLEPGDAVLVTRHWATTPIFYYLDAEQHRVIYKDYAEALAATPARRVWVLSFPFVPVPVGTALDGYRETGRLEAREIWVSLFEKLETKTPATEAATEL